MKKSSYSCDVCRLVFTVRAQPADGDEVLCPRCRTRFVRPLPGKAASTKNRPQIPRYTGCG
jgi:hypothetical protein